MKQFVKRHKKQLSMGSQPAHDKIKQENQHPHRQQFDANIFKAQINKMKFIRSKNNHQSIKKFKQKSDQTQLAINSALANLKKNQLLNTGEFLNLKGDKNKYITEQSLENQRLGKFKVNTQMRKSSSNKSDVKLPILNFKPKNIKQASQTNIKPIIQKIQREILRVKSRRALTFKAI